MQLSMANLNSPSSRIVKDATPFRHRILRCINLGNGESSPNNFLDVVNLYLIKFKERWILNEMHFILLLFCLFESESLPKIINQLGESSPNFIFAGVNLDPIVFEKRWTNGESWPNDFVEKVNRGEDLRWVGSRCPLMHALVFPMLSLHYYLLLIAFHCCKFVEDLYDNGMLFVQILQCTDQPMSVCAKGNVLNLFCRYSGPIP